MKKAIGMTFLSFAGIAAVWAILEYVFSLTSNGDFVQNMMRPIHMIPCAVAAVLAAACVFLSVRKRIC